MEIELNWLAIAVATIVSMVVSGLWYGKLFVKTWRKLTGVSEVASRNAGKTPMLILLVSNFITSVAMAVAINISEVFFADKSIFAALLVGFVLWLAFSATTLIQHNTFEQKPQKLTWINILYQLVLLVSMALVFGIFRV